jgi:flagellar protein FlaG
MAIKAVDSIADIGAAREMIQAHAAARRTSGHPGQADTPGANVAPHAAAAAATEAEQKAQQKQPEAQEQQAQAPTNPSLRFHVDKDSGKTIAELVDPEGQVLRQMPTEEALEIAKAIGKFQGMFVNLKV